MKIPPLRQPVRMRRMLYHKALRALCYGSAAMPYTLCFASLPVPPVPLQPPDHLAYGKLSQWVLMLPRLSTLCMEKTILFPTFFSSSLIDPGL
jgi:hypothetical protein